MSALVALSLTKAAKTVRKKLNPEEKNSRQMYFKYDRQLKKLEREGLDKSEEAKKVKEKRNSFLTPSLKAEIKAKAIVRNDEEWRSLSRSERKDLVKERLKSMNSNGLITLLHVESFLKNLEDWVKESPEVNNKTFRAGILAARYLRNKLRKESSVEAKSGIDDNLLRRVVEESPKYSRTPGRSKPIERVDPAGYKSFLESKIGKLEEKENELTEGERRWLYSLKSRLRHAGWGVYKNPLLNELYDMQGYNAKPEIVARRKDLENRKDLIQGDDGKALLVWRGLKGKITQISSKELDQMGTSIFREKG